MKKICRGKYVIITPEGQMLPFKGKSIPHAIAVLKKDGDSVYVRLEKGARMYGLERIPGRTWEEAAACMGVDSRALQAYAATCKWLLDERLRLDEMELDMALMKLLLRRGHTEYEAARRSWAAGWWPPAQ